MPLYYTNCTYFICTVVEQLIQDFLKDAEPHGNYVLFVSCVCSLWVELVLVLVLVVAKLYPSYKRKPTYREPATTPNSVTVNIKQAPEMILTILSRALLAISLIGCSVAITIPPLHSQQILHSTASHYKNVDAVIMTEARQQVPGDNPAYFCGPTPPNQQLFEIEEFIIAPDPPEVYVNLTYLPLI
jgi:hypothetical protein